MATQDKKCQDVAECVFSVLGPFSIVNDVAAWHAEGGSLWQQPGGAVGLTSGLERPDVEARNNLEPGKPAAFILLLQATLV